jgi:hypothetical protein
MWWAVTKRLTRQIDVTKPSTPLPPQNVRQQVALIASGPLIASETSGLRGTSQSLL